MNEELENNEMEEGEFDARKYIRILLDGFLDEAQSSDLLIFARVAGNVEGILMAGMASGIVDSELMDEYTGRLEAITALKENNVLDMDPFLMIPDNKKGHNLIKRIHSKMNGCSEKEAFSYFLKK